MDSAAPTASLPTLVTLAVAFEKIGAPLRTGYRLIREGRLAAVKIGREYHVDPVDVAELLRPRLRSIPAPSARETPSQREARQLAAAGIATAK